MDTAIVNLEGLTQGKNTKFGRYNDFACDSELTSTEPFVITTVGGTAFPTACANEKYGVVDIVTGATEDDGHQIQDERENFRTDEQYEQTLFYCRCEIDVAVQSDLFLGLSILDTSVIASAPTDSIGFQSDDGDAQIDVRCGRNSAYTTQENVATLDTGTHEFAFMVEPDSDDSVNATISWYIDGKLVYKFRPYATLGDNEKQCDDNPHDEELSRTVAVLNGASAAVTLSLDALGAWIFSPTGRAPSL